MLVVDISFFFLNLASLSFPTISNTFSAKGFVAYISAVDATDPNFIFLRLYLGIEGFDLIVLFCQL